MSRDLDKRLNSLLTRLTDEDFLAGTGIGNEIGIYIFDYDPADEIRVRRYIHTLQTHLPKERPGMRVAHVNLFELTLDYLRSRRLLDKTLSMGQELGDAALVDKLSNKVVAAEKICPLLIEKAKPDDNDLVMISGVGSVYPMLWAHSLLNNIHTLIPRTPLVLFHPGRYTGKDLRIFDQSTLAQPYYRAIRI